MSYDGPEPGEQKSETIYRAQCPLCPYVAQADNMDTLGEDVRDHDLEAHGISHEI